MPKIEVDETEWAAQQQVTKLVADMLNNPESRAQVLKAKKTVRPNEPVPEIDAAQRGYEEIAAIRKELEEDRKARIKEKEEADASKKAQEFESTWNKQKSSLRADGWLDDGIANIEKLAQERGIPDLEAAALLYKKLHPEPEPIQPSSYGRWNAFEMPSGDDNNSFMKKLIETHGDSESVLDNEIRAALNEVRGATPARRI